MPLSVVWFKRDLRIDDHLPLARAAERGALIALYVYEPTLLASPEYDASHLVFIDQCLAELDAALRARGGALVYRRGEMAEVLSALHRTHRFDALFSHEETGTRLTWDRDRAVAAWCRAHGVTWTEIAQNGVVRRLRSRDGWARRWTQRMAQPLTDAPAHVFTPVAGTARPGAAPLDPGRRLRPQDTLLGASDKPDAQRGGEHAAQAVLASFLAARGVSYQKGMSSPVSAFEACSRLSTYLAWGAISLRRVAQSAAARAEELRALRARPDHDIDPRWGASLRAFQGRLRWHCHFMQKLEDEPRIEFENFSRAYDALREAAIAPDSEAARRFVAWQRGETGYPMVDACMRALHRGGWINFRMRAMLVSFASYHLWLHWRPTGVYLARHFLDFEPGIHFSQFQMQSGTTGINTVRIYSPAKQVLDHDPQGVFIRQQLPQLARVPQRWLAEPHLMPASVQREAGCLIGRDYPPPIVAHAVAYREARTKIAAIRRSSEARAQADAIQEKHGSRRSGLPPSTRRRAPPAATGATRTSTQSSLFDDDPVTAPD